MAKATIKSLRGQPEIYDETKHRYTMCLTPTASELLSSLGEALGLSRSELIEQLLRGTVTTTDLETAKAQIAATQPTP